MREIDLVNRTRRTPMYCSYKMVPPSFFELASLHQLSYHARVPPDWHLQGMHCVIRAAFFWTTRGQEWHVHQTSPESVNVGKSQFGNQIFWPCKVRTSWVLKLKESKFMVHSGPCLAMPCHPQKPRRQPGTAMSTCCGWAWRTKGPPLVLSVVTGNYLSLVNKISIDP